MGYTGSIGYVGSKGDLGGTGYVGSKGADGTFGGASFDYFYSTSTTNADPGSGNLKFDSILISSVTTLYINKLDANGISADSFLQTIDDSTSAIKGHFSVRDKDLGVIYSLFTIIGPHVEHATYLEVPVGYLTGATTFTDNLETIITFARTGDGGVLPD